MAHALDTPLYYAADDHAIIPIPIIVLESSR
jgi:hypothetical protein